MKKNISAYMEKNIPIIIGAAFIIGGILHILVSSCFMIKIPMKFFSDLHDIVNLSKYSTNAGVLIGIFLGFCMIIIGKGVCERKTKSWYIAMIILIILSFNNYYLRAIPEINIFIIIVIVLLLVFRKYFNVKNDIAMGYQQILAWVSISIALAYGVCGSYLLRNDFTHINTWTDAVYFTFVTYSTVGYGEITPLTQHAKFFTITMILVGLGSFATTFTFLIGPMIENRMKGVLSIMKKINNIHDHIILCGYTPLSRALIKQFEENNVPFLIIENSPEKKSEINEKYTAIAGNSFQKETFYNARIEYAKAVITTFDKDSDNILTLLTVKDILDANYDNDTKLITRIEYEENIEKAEKLGATEIVSPTSMAASHIVSSSLL